VCYPGKQYATMSDQLRLHFVQEHHDTALAGHPGQAQTFDLLNLQYYWEDMRRQVPVCMEFS